jgi:dipeptidyl aminopeptidase/acylaminoacyl peptidase
MRARTIMRPSTPSILMQSILLLTTFFIALCAGSFTPKDMLSAPRASPAIPNPNGTVAVYTQTTYSFDTDSRTGGIYLLPISSKFSSSSKVIINDTNASDPIWLDDRTLLYIYTKGGESSLRTYDTELSKDSEITSFQGAIGNLKGLSVGDGTVRIAFSAKVTPYGDIVRSNETATPEALIYDKLWVRHWDEWITSNKNSIFSGTLTLKDGKYSVDSFPINMLNSTEDIHDLESPIPPFGGSDDYSLSTTHLAFVAKDPHLNPATNTASHVYVVSFNDSKYLEEINRGPGASSSPVWSPDGEHLAYLEMRVRGYESDRICLVDKKLMVGRRVVVFKRETHEYLYLTEEWDRSPSSILWAQDGKSLFLTVEDCGRNKLYQLKLEKGKYPQEKVSENSITGVFWAGKDDLLLSQSSLTDPTIIKFYDTSKSSVHQIFTTWLSNPLSRKSVQEFWFKGYNDHPVHGFLHLPEEFDRKKKYPLAFLIHGGPQGAWEDGWSTRWNPAVFANAGDGWIVAAINPTGSTGYGQNFTDAIQGNWGTIPCNNLGNVDVMVDFDLEAGYEFLWERYEFIDANRTVALGGSYGGYMVVLLGFC